MRCPNCGEEVRVGKTNWECEWCGDSGMVECVSDDEPESVTITVTISVAENEDESEAEAESAPDEPTEPRIDPERAKRLLAEGNFPEDEDICREVLAGAYPEEIEEFDESGDSPCWNILYDIFVSDPEKAIEMWRYLLDIAGDLLKTDPETAEELLPDWDLFDPPDKYAIEPLFDALRDERFAKQIFGSAYVGSLQPDILKVCFENGAKELGRRCLALVLANPHLSKRRAESIKLIASDAENEELPEDTPEIPPDDGKIYHYCMVLVNAASRPYAYLTGGLPLKVGDLVEVPFGKDNAIRRGEVKEVMDCTSATAPWSPEKTKTVARMAFPSVVEPAWNHHGKLDENQDGKPIGNPAGQVISARTDPIVSAPANEPERTETESKVNESAPRIFEKTNTRKEFPYGKLIAALLVADAIAIIALIICLR